MPGRKTVLVIDDDADIHEFCRSVLEAAGYRVTTAASAAAGLADAKAHTPDLIILDVIMEESDSGFKVAAQLAKQVPIIMLTSIADASGQVFDTSTLGVRELIQKPIDPVALRATVARLLA